MMHGVRLDVIQASTEYRKPHGWVPSGAVIASCYIPSAWILSQIKYAMET
jgi:hypothetical protein